MMVRVTGVEKKTAMAAGKKPERYGRKAARPSVMMVRQRAVSTRRGSDSATDSSARRRRSETISIAA